MRLPIEAGRVISDRYRLQAPLGRGTGGGRVWRAQDQILDRDVAIKGLWITESATNHELADAYARMMRGARSAARLSHPNIVAVYDVVEEHGEPWVVMQLIKSLSLDLVLAASGPLSPRRAAVVGQQLLSALSAAHAVEVLHRDIAPSNVLVDVDDRAALTDFGIAMFQGDPRLTRTGIVLGTPGFIAPERVLGGRSTPASDLWSLGATLYAAVEGHGPYENIEGVIPMMSAIVHEDAPLSRAAGALGSVISALLQRSPGERPDAAAAAGMITDAIQFLSDDTIPVQARTIRDTGNYLRYEIPRVATPRIFISYRREDTSFLADWLFEWLASQFGAAQVFKDIESIQLGDNFVEIINTALDSCDVLLALIGDRWLTSTDERGLRRLDDPQDFVRLEIEVGLARNIRIIPILVAGARMPRAEELPASLTELAYRNPLELSRYRYRSEFSVLLPVLDKILNKPPSPTSP